MRDFGRPINRIVLHCTASSTTASVDDIKKYWRDVKGWRNFGYHYLIGRNGERHILSHLSEVTNGVRGYNWDSCHISYIGGRNGVDNRTPAQKSAMKKLIKELRSPAILGPLPVVGHRDLSPDRDGNGIITSEEYTKLCPSFDTATWLKEDNVI
jgi:N-acetyl-anhydromuramyl-L-alanine amidase AmpD